MPQQQRSLRVKIFLGLLASVYLVYLASMASFVYTSVSTLSQTIIEHAVNANSDTVIKHWTALSMSAATDQQISDTPHIVQSNIDTSKGKSARQQGQLPRNGDLSYPTSTVGKMFFTNAAGQAFVCSGTALSSSNHSVVDTAGHCLYWYGEWVQNLIFCPLYKNGDTPYGCWAARDLEVPSDWIHANPNDLHHDMGMVIVTPKSQGDLTDLVGGAGWAYNQAINQSFYAYGYPAGYPFDGQTRRSCEGSIGTSWSHGGGTVVSIPCDMNGGSSGGPWFIKISGKWYLNGHNDFTSSMQPDHMFSPYYDDTWYSLYEKAQHA